MLTFEEKYAKYQREYCDALVNVLNAARNDHLDTIDDQELKEWCETVDIKKPSFLNTELYGRIRDLLAATTYQNVGRASPQPFWDMLEFAHGSLVELCHDRAKKYADYWNAHRDDVKAELEDKDKIVTYIVFV